MGFYVDVTDRDLEHLREWLTPAGFTRVRDWIVATLENCSDSFREERRISPPAGSEGLARYFEVIHFLFDGGRFCRVRLFVDDAGAAYGVLRVAFLDYHTRESF